MTDIFLGQAAEGGEIGEADGGEIGMLPLVLRLLCVAGGVVDNRRGKEPCSVLEHVLTESLSARRWCGDLELSVFCVKNESIVPLAVGML